MPYEGFGIKLSSVIFDYVCSFTELIHELKIDDHDAMRAGFILKVNIIIRNINVFLAF